MVCIKLKLSVCVEGDIGETKNWNAHTANNAATTAATAQAKGIQVKLLRIFLADVELNQNKLRIWTFKKLPKQYLKNCL
jgi:hypothetical protein